MSTHRLIIVRHAKTEQLAETDHARVLTERGHRDAAAGADWLRERGYVPHVVLVSSAARARQTADILAEGMGTTDVRVDDALYSAGPQDVLDSVRAIEDDAETLMVVGHNPTMADVSYHLSADDSCHDLPTSGIVVLDVDSTWGAVARERTSLVERHTPRG